jgi:hypothetical protein
MRRWLADMRRKELGGDRRGVGGRGERRDRVPQGWDIDGTHGATGAGRCLSLPSVPERVHRHGGDAAGTQWSSARLGAGPHERPHERGHDAPRPQAPAPPQGLIKRARSPRSSGLCWTRRRSLSSGARGRQPIGRPPRRRRHGGPARKLPVLWRGSPRRRAVPTPADARVSTPRQSPLQLSARAARGLAHVRCLRRSPGARQAVLRLLRPSLATGLGVVPASVQGTNAHAA